MSFTKSLLKKYPDTFDASEIDELLPGFKDFFREHWLVKIADGMRMFHSGENAPLDKVHAQFKVALHEILYVFNLWRRIGFFQQCYVDLVFEAAQPHYFEEKHADEEVDLTSPIAAILIS